MLYVPDALRASLMGNPTRRWTKLQVSSARMGFGPLLTLISHRVPGCGLEIKPVTLYRILARHSAGAVFFLEGLVTSGAQVPHALRFKPALATKVRSID
jgi:hypothetical protein